MKGDFISAGKSKGGINYMRIVGGTAAVCMFLCVLICAVAAGQGDEALKDGSYEGEHSFIGVTVKIANGKIADIKMTRHGGGGEKYAAMVSPLIGKMIDAQSTDVDAITGATVSSENLKKAVDNALEKARAGSGS